MTQSSWEETKRRSKYHFNQFFTHPDFDTVDRIGSVMPSWTENQIKLLIEESKAVTWRTRGNPEKESKVRSEEDFISEEYDLENQGYDKDYKVTNLNWEVPHNIRSIAESFCLEEMMARIHVQHPGQVWNLHMDKLEKWCPENPDLVERYMIQLTDWQLGQFWSYGNYNYCQWRAGDVTTFNWKDIPHSTANASHYPRVTLQVTGIKTPRTEHFISKLRDLDNSNKSYLCKLNSNMQLDLFN